MILRVKRLWLLSLLFAALAIVGQRPLMAQDTAAPTRIAEAFLGGWAAGDYTAMYALLSQQSQALYSDAVFQTRYDDAAAAINFSALGFTLHDTLLQGSSAAVTYDVTFESRVFGHLEDTGRTLRLVQETGAWRVAWSNLDIFDSLPANGRLAVETRRQPRGNIYARDGRPLVEQGGTSISLFMAREDVFDEANCLDLLGEVLGTERSRLAQLFSANLPETIFLVGEIDPERDAARGAELDATCGIRFRTERSTRRYFGHGIATHLTGYIGQIPATQLDLWLSRGYQQGDLVGLAGIEGELDDVLSGQAERLLRIVEAGGTTLRELAGTAGTAPQSVTLTIDRDLQQATALAMSDAYNFAAPNWGGISPGAAAVVLDVNSGAVLAMASYPTFDPGIFNPDTPVANVGEVIARLNSDPRQPLFNRALQGQYSPGSVFKIATTVAAAAEGLMGPDEIFSCGLEWNGAEFGDTLPVRFDWRLVDEFPPAGDITITQALTASCDPFFYEMGARLYNERGPNVLVDYARQLGLGGPTGLSDLEAQGSLAAPNSVAAAINNAIGQGDVSLSPLQIALMTAAVANGGTVYQPYLIQQIGGADGAPVSFQAQPEILREIDVDPQVFEIVRDAMCAVTTDTDLGTAWFVFDDANYLACGKTGTAQTLGAPNAWFVAYAPAQQPEIAIVVMAEQSREGSEVAAPIVRRILDFYLGEPAAAFPDWWNSGPYIPIDIPEGGTGGG